MLCRLLTAIFIFTMGASVLACSSSRFGDGHVDADAELGCVEHAEDACWAAVSPPQLCRLLRTGCVSLMPRPTALALPRVLKRFRHSFKYFTSFAEGPPPSQTSFRVRSVSVRTRFFSGFSTPFHGSRIFPCIRQRFSKELLNVSTGLSRS